MIKVPLTHKKKERSGKEDVAEAGYYFLLAGREQGGG